MTLAEELEAEGMAKGMVKGGCAELRNGITHVLGSRGLRLNAVERAELDAIEELDALQEILVRATTAESVGEALRSKG